MSGKALTDEGFAGLFGKLPSTGDFVVRGLPDAFRARWDAWVTRHLAWREEFWPEGGLRLRLRSGTRTASGLVLPSCDSAGRRFPLSALLILPCAPEPAEVDRWCNAALPLMGAALAGEGDADGLWHGLDALPRPEAPREEGAAPLLLWTAGAEPRQADAADPETALNDLLSSRGSPSP